jgi:cell division protein FtsW
MAKRLFWLILIFLGFGLIVLSSASVVEATKKFGTSSYFWQHQLFYGIAPGLLLLGLFWKIDYRRLRSIALPILLFAFVLMVLVLMPSLGIKINGSRSWLDIGPISFQPAEALKLALVVYLAAWFSERGDRLKKIKFGLLPFAVIMGVVTVLLLRQPDLGTLGVISIIAGGMFFLAGAPLRQAVGVLVILGVLVLGYAATSPVRWKRVTTLLNPLADARGSGWQINQSLIAIGSGGVWGVGLGQSTQKFGFLPEPIGDSIFAILVEELGMAGGLFTLSLFAAFTVLMLTVARHTHDGFGSLLVSGMCLWVMTQALVNMAAVTGLLPLTGVPLPFVSYGGTSMTAMLAGLGIALNVAERHS